MPPLRPWLPGAPTLWFLVGLPGSGKSTWVQSRLLNNITPTHIASTDDVLERFAREDGTSYSIAHRTRFKDAEREFKAEMILAAQQGKDIIVDRTNVSESSRRKVVALVESSAREVYIRKAVIFNIEMNELATRLALREQNTGKAIPMEVIETMKRDYVEPSPSDFHVLYRVP